ncbi:MAG: hypothetical protein K2I19_02345 [Muribaculaceae bacterium]|nr:hypothetical protein [Muribaculaceae bacterium]
MSHKRQPRVPRRFLVVTILFMLPVLGFPTLLGKCSDDSPLTSFVWFYPLYVLAAGICALMCYRDRRELAWILLAIMLLTHIALWYSIL